MCATARCRRWRCNEYLSVRTISLETSAQTYLLTHAQMDSILRQCCILTIRLYLHIERLTVLDFREAIRSWLSCQRM